MVLLVIDAQKQIVNDRLYCLNDFICKIQTLLEQARKSGVEVIYVRHDDGPGQELTPGRDGFEIAPAFAPAAGEKIFDKTVNSAFRGTGLLEYLGAKGEKQLIVTGLQTDYCMDATVKCGFEHGFEILLPEHTNSTVDNDYLTAEQSYRYYNSLIWPGRYAQCLTLAETLERIRRQPG